MNQLASIDISSSKRQCSTMNGWTPSVFEEVTDLLAEMLLDDLKQYPQITTKHPIDSLLGRENTAVLAPEDRT